MKKLFLSVASIAMLAGFGATYAETTLDAAAMDEITAAGSRCNTNNHGTNNHGKNRGGQTLVSIGSPTVQNNTALNTNAANVGWSSANQNAQQSNQYGNFDRSVGNAAFQGIL